MISSVVTPGSRPTPSTPHQYGTRIRSNSVIRPSIRLRQSPAPSTAPRRIKPVPTPKSKAPPTADSLPADLPPFPPPHVMLHSDDANSKVFLAIGRSFMSIDNCAMTIKDLAEMTINFGLMCQNVSAAGQAITTYIRTHLQRCEVQQDHPLLLRHVLSGTPSDDELVSALHSRVGGAHCTLNASHDRITNFRRGTMVWYLSKAAGAPCPFARAGIRLSDYTENGKVGSVLDRGLERKRERDRLRRAAQCGQKRKRLTRACADKGSDSESMSEEEKRPPKVKLTLRLRPASATTSSSYPSPSPPPSGMPYVPQSREIIDLSRDSDSGSDSDSSESDESDSDSMSVDSSSDDDAEAEALTGDVMPETTSSHLHTDFRRSPSVPRSIMSASPPPDSEDEDEDFHISMTGFLRPFTYRRASVTDEDEDEEDDMSWDDDVFDFDTETQWESPGPRSPSVQFEDEAIVKQEPSDVGGLLDAWDDLHGSTVDLKVVDVVAQAATGILPEYSRPKLEDLDSWLFYGFHGSGSDSFAPSPMEDSAPPIKQEELEFGVPLFLDGLLTPPPDHEPTSSPISPVSPSLVAASDMLAARRSSDLEWRDAELLGPDSVEPQDLDASVWDNGHRASRRTADSPTITEALDPPRSLAPSHMAALAMRLTLPPRLNLAQPDTDLGRKLSTSDLRSPALCSFLTSLTIKSPTSPGVSRSDHPPQPSTAEHAFPSPESGASHTQNTVEPQRREICHPSDPAITLATFEGIMVYQMTLGSSLILRRCDTDFVNTTPIMKELNVAHLSCSTATRVAKGSAAVCGSWVPLVAAQETFKEHPVLRTFLSDHLIDCFPSALESKALSSLPSQSVPHFGPDFQSTMDIKRRSLSSIIASQESDASWERGHNFHWDLEEHLFSTHPTFAVVPMLPPPAASQDQLVTAELPLSPTEEEMFRVLCSNEPWETTPPGPSVADVSRDDAEVPAGAERKEEDSNQPDRPLRRSKRVADAIANRTRTRSGKRGSRSALS